MGPTLSALCESANTLSLLLSLALWGSVFAFVRLILTLSITVIQLSLRYGIPLDVSATIYLCLPGCRDRNSRVSDVPDECVLSTWAWPCQGPGSRREKSKAFSPGGRLRGQWDGGVCARRLSAVAFSSWTFMAWRLLLYRACPYCDLVKPVPWSSCSQWPCLLVYLSAVTLPPCLSICNDLVAFLSSV